MTTSQDLVLVTGGSGFLGAHCIVTALKQGYRVRTTIRSLKREDEVREMARVGGVPDEQAKSIEFVAADLMKDEGWSEACKDCTYVLHVASPFPAAEPKHPDDLIVPARDGTLRVLKAAKAAGTVKRVVVTSSLAAISYGHNMNRTETFTEKDWSKLPPNNESPIGAYQQSKTHAERAAWDWIAAEGGEMELSVVNPGGIFGPIFSKDFATSILIITRLMNGDVPGIPRLMITAVDVRDVADLHLLAMTHPDAAGERFFCIADESFVWFRDVALVLKDRLGDKASKVPTRGVPNVFLKLFSFFDKQVALIVPELGKERKGTNEKAKRLLGWRPRTWEECIVASGESVVEFGLVK